MKTRTCGPGRRTTHAGVQRANRGAVYIPKSADDLDDAFAQISADLAQQYILSYYPAQDKRDGKYHLIAIKVKTKPMACARAKRICG